ncbi:MAG: hypothetical protein JJ908_11340 [Rhizobiales bacterium]|nr:hypothetical protein [Hyphomicrobiales bacterium]MBO6699416.1 hypothetical protein [Hyphomicrobiales bacterium]MBO6736954.1 hypothetical protein [Hyphomicrobiales bacterium]MBO6911972.1 hypothetical protein [Hyphomicrobiales bacterium]MBO6954660.1 hypothetical protein [Hyphomicrobiales bacterium]
MPPEASIRAITAADFGPLAAMGLDQTIAMRAQAQDMGWVLGNGDEIFGAATAYLTDGTVFLDRLLGSEPAQLQLIDHALAYARWSYAPALTLCAPANADTLLARGFVGIDPDRLTSGLHAAANGRKVLMRRL